MTTTITDGTTTWTPDLIDGFETPKASRNVFHDLVGTTDVAVTLRPAALRRGTWKAIFGTTVSGIGPQARAESLRDGLAQAKTFTIADSAPSFSIKFALDGEIRTALDSQGRRVWIVTFGFREVP